MTFTLTHPFGAGSTGVVRVTQDAPGAGTTVVGDWSLDRHGSLVATLPDSSVMPAGASYTLSPVVNGQALPARTVAPQRAGTRASVNDAIPWAAVAEAVTEVASEVASTYVATSAQVLTPDQQTQSRANISAVSVAELVAAVRSTLILAEDMSNSTTTGAAVTGFAIPAGLTVGTYEVDARVFVVSAASTTGARLALHTTTGVTPAVRWAVPITATTESITYDRAGDVYTTGTDFPATAGDPYLATMTGLLTVTATTTDPVQVYLKSEVGASAVTVKAGSVLTWMKLSDTVTGGGGGGVTPPTNPAGTLIFQDAYTGTDGAAWGSNWTTGYTGTNGAAATLDTNRGKITTGATVGYAANDRIARRYTSTISDFHALFTFDVPTSTEEIYPYLNFRCDNADLDMANGYSLAFKADALELYKVASYTPTLLGNVARTLTKGVKWWCRVQGIGSALKVKTWLESVEEPSAWDIEATDATYSAANYWGFQVAGSGTAASQVILIDDLHVAQS